MDGMEDKLGAILNNPQMMQQIMSMAQTLGANQEQTQHEEHAQSAKFPEFDPAILQNVMGLAQQLGADSQQQALLCALEPYLSQRRIVKLEKAMRAAKLANAASAAFSSGALSFLTGR